MASKVSHMQWIALHTCTSLLIAAVPAIRLPVTQLRLLETLARCATPKLIERTNWKQSVNSNTVFINVLVDVSSHVVFRQIGSRTLHATR